MHPKKALNKRVLYIALWKNKIVGLIAGHLTKRYDCDGELQWINVQTKYKNKGISTSLLKTLAIWFTQHNAKLVCIDVDPENIEVVNFYKKHNAIQFNEQWMIWQDISILAKGI